MSPTLFPFMIFGIVLVLVVMSLAIWRKMVAMSEDDSLHVLADSDLIPKQEAVAHKLEAIDKWGKVLTIVTVVYAFLIVAFFVYQQWVHSTALPKM